MPFLTRFSGGRGKSKPNNVGRVRGVQTTIFLGGQEGSKPKFFSAHFARRSDPPPPVKKFNFYTDLKRCLEEIKVSNSKSILSKIILSCCLWLGVGGLHRDNLQQRTSINRCIAKNKKSTIYILCSIAWFYANTKKFWGVANEYLIYVQAHKNVLPTHPPPPHLYILTLKHSHTHK